MASPCAAAQLSQCGGLVPMGSQDKHSPKTGSSRCQSLQVHVRQLWRRPRKGQCYGSVFDEPRELLHSPGVGVVLAASDPWPFPGTGWLPGLMAPSTVPGGRACSGERERKKAGHLKQVPGPVENLALCQGQLVFREQLSGVDKLGLLNPNTILRFFFLSF